MLKGYQILDADSHVMEPLEMWEEYLEPAFKSFAPKKQQKTIAQTASSRVIEIDLFEPAFKNLTVSDEKIYYNIPDAVWNNGGERAPENLAQYDDRTYSPESQLQAMEKLGVDLAFLYPTAGLWLFAIDKMEPQVAGAFIRAYNNWLRDFCSCEPKLLRGIGAINLHEPAEMVSELRRIAEFGWKAVFLRPNPVKGRLLSDRAYEEFWTECERLNIAVSIHEGTHSRLPTVGSDRFKTRFGMHACSHPIEQMMALLALIEGGVLERHPQLRVAFLESGCGWLPYWLWRLDEEYHNLSWEVKDNVKMKPSEYFRRQCFIAVEPSEPYLSEVIRYIGEDNLIFGTDYPHIDFHSDITMQAVGLEKRLSKDIVQKILWDNPRRFYGLE
jgi:predicted TIM-barrel fold metal-dependent hydrolase